MAGCGLGAGALVPDLLMRETGATQANREGRSGCGLGVTLGGAPKRPPVEVTSQESRPVGWEAPGEGLQAEGTASVRA